MKLVIKKETKKNKVFYVVFDEEADRDYIFEPRVKREYLSRLKHEFPEYFRYALLSSVKLKIGMACPVDAPKEAHEEFRSNLELIINEIEKHKTEGVCVKCYGTTVPCRFEVGADYYFGIDNRCGTKTDMKAQVCTECGYMEVYSTNPKDLL